MVASRLVGSLEARLVAVTPLFLGGADGDERAELRTPSVKGALRLWYRALDGSYRTREGELFGSTSRQASCGLRVGPPQVGTERWAQEEYRQRKWSGLGYLGYSLRLGSNDRKALPAGTTFTLRLAPRPGQDGELLRRAWAGALWLLAHVGGLGSRSRRGLGSLRLEEWSGWSEVAELPLAGLARGPVEWRERFERGLGVLRSWFPEPAPDHLALARGGRFLLLRQGWGRWEEALDDGGRRLQRFRQRREPDYGAVKAHLAWWKGLEAAGVEPRRLERGPERAGFGLPLTFRYRSLAYRDERERTPETTFRGVEHDRLASPLFIRVVRLGDGYHALFARLPAPLLGGEPLREERDSEGRRPLAWHPGAATVVDRFLDEGVVADAVEVRL